MATTQLSDIYNAVVYQDLPAVHSPEKTLLFQSGAVVKSQLLDSLASAEGKTAELPFWKDLDATQEPNLSTDNPASNATPNKVVQGEQLARKAFLNNGWSATDLATELAVGAEALQHVKNRVETYWARQWQRRLIATALGVQADNAAANSGDMTHSVAVEANASVTAATKFSRANFINATFTMGDRTDGITAIAVHSAVAKQIAEQGDAEDVVDADGRLLYQSYMGKRIIVDDALPAVAGTTDGVKYLSILFGAGAFGYGDGDPTTPSAVERDEKAADGGGIETLWTRKTWILHPFGYKNTGTPAKVSFSTAELKAATTWERVVERKNVPLAFLWTN